MPEGGADFIGLPAVICADTLHRMLYFRVKSWPPKLIVVVISDL
jgi:hypothetical protein